MSTNSDHHSARKSPSVGHGRCGTFPYSLYVSPRTVSPLRSFWAGMECRIVAEQAYEQITTNTYENRRITLWDRRGIACGVDACDGEAARASLSLVLSTALSVLKIAGEGIKRCVRLPRCMCSNGKLCKLHFRTRTQHVYSVCCGTATVCNYITGYGAVW